MKEFRWNTEKNAQVKKDRGISLDLSKEENELMTSIENEEWVEIKNFAEEKLKYEQYARKK
jgi:hypothetical protein